MRSIATRAFCCTSSFRSLTEYALRLGSKTWKIPTRMSRKMLMATMSSTRVKPS